MNINQRLFSNFQVKIHCVTFILLLVNLVFEKGKNKIFL